MSVPAVATGGPVLVTARSADVATADVAVDVLFAALESAVVATAVGVLLSVEQLAVPAQTWTTSWKVAVPLAAKILSVAVIVPPPPTGGLVIVKAGPDVCVAETKVVSAGTASLSVTFWASLGPLFVSVTV